MVESVELDAMVGWEISTYSPSWYFNLITADECASISDCVENATCVNSPDGFVCLCPFGSMGDGRMSGNGCFLDECSSISDCVGNANCVNSPDGFVCLCPPDLTGDGRISGTGCNGWLGNQYLFSIMVF
jgi:hypothetical protein